MFSDEIYDDNGFTRFRDPEMGRKMDEFLGKLKKRVLKEGEVCYANSNFCKTQIQERDGCSSCESHPACKKLSDFMTKAVLIALMGGENMLDGGD